MDDFNEEVIWFIRHCGLDPGVAGVYIQAAGILLFVSTILWFIFPYLPDEPERGWGPKKKKPH